MRSFLPTAPVFFTLCPMRHACRAIVTPYRDDAWRFALKSAIRNPKSQIESVRHFDLSRIGCCGVFKEMIGLIHDVIEPAIKLPAIFLARLAGSVGRYMN